mmetsp:Transcript_28435/g.63483  ORF Transcript_28435/g.63483 Transcript_28435/m.63483 type:complete len:244 (-) Transcript_28435:217-948(-)
MALKMIMGLLLLVAHVGAFLAPPSCIRKSSRTLRTLSSTPLVTVDCEKPMGIVFEENDGGGLYVLEVAPDSAASKVGVAPGDQLLKVAGDDVSKFYFDAAMDLLQKAPSPANLELFRGSVEELNSFQQGSTEDVSKSQSKGPTLVTVEQEGPSATVSVTGEKILRTALLEAKIDIYTFKGKLTNCNGGGQCGTCIVDVIKSDSGALSNRTPVEEARLKNKGPSFRLACQAVCQGGDISIKTKP